MKLQGKAYVVKDEWGQGVYIMHNTGSNEIPFQLRYFEKIHDSYNHDSAENLCLSLNSWRESYAQDCIDQTISLMEEINDQVRVEKIAGS